MRRGAYEHGHTDTRLRRRPVPCTPSPTLAGRRRRSSRSRPDRCRHLVPRRCRLSSSPDPSSPPEREAAWKPPSPFDPFSSELLDDPHRKYRQLQDRAPALFLEDLGGLDRDRSRRRCFHPPQSELGDALQRLPDAPAGGSRAGAALLPGDGRTGWRVGRRGPPPSQRIVLPTLHAPTGAGTLTRRRSDGGEADRRDDRG